MIIRKGSGRGRNNIFAFVRWLIPRTSQLKTSCILLWGSMIKHVQMNPNQSPNIIMADFFCIEQTIPFVWNMDRGNRRKTK